MAWGSIHMACSPRRAIVCVRGLRRAFRGRMYMYVYPILRYTLESKVQPKPSFVLRYFSSSKSVVLVWLHVGSSPSLNVLWARVTWFSTPWRL